MLEIANDDFLTIFDDPDLIIESEAERATNLAGLLALIGATLIERTVMGQFPAGPLTFWDEAGQDFGEANQRLGRFVDDMKRPEMSAEAQWASTVTVMTEMAQDSPDNLHGILEIAVAAFMRLAGRSDGDQEGYPSVRRSR